MAVDYSFAIDSNDTLLDFATWIESRCGFRMFCEKGNYVLTGDGISCVVKSQSLLGQELVNEIFSVNSKLDVICRINKFEFFEAGMDNLVLICLRIINETASDFVMLSNGERGLVLRKNGSVTVDFSDAYWETKWKEAFSLIQLQYSTHNLPLM